MTQASVRLQMSLDLVAQPQNNDNDACNLDATSELKISEKEAKIGNPGLFFGLFKQSTNDKTINKQVGHFFHLNIGDRSRTFGHEFGRITIDHWTKTKKKT